MSNVGTGIHADRGLSFPLHKRHVEEHQAWARMSGLLKDESTHLSTPAHI
jgi:hypothetical protein